MSRAFRNGEIPLILLLLALGFPGARSVAGEATLNPVADTSLFAVVPTNNLGAASTLAVGGIAKGLPARALMRFDVAAALPAGAVVTGAQLGFTVTKAPGGAVPSSFSLHRVLRSWGEGGGGRAADFGDLGRGAVPGEATWEARSHPDALWAQPGGAREQDIVTAASGTVKVAGTGAYAVEAAGLADDVRQWLADPGTNFGWMLVGDAEDVALTARRLGSREDAARAPVLRIDYVTVSPPVIVRWERVGDRCELEFRAEAGNIYEVHVRPSFGIESPWQVLTNYIVKLVSTNIVVSEHLTGREARYYRVADVGDVD